MGRPPVRVELHAGRLLPLPSLRIGGVHDLLRRRPTWRTLRAPRGTEPPPPESTSIDPTNEGTQGLSGRRRRVCGLDGQLRRSAGVVCRHPPLCLRISSSDSHTIGKAARLLPPRDARTCRPPQSCPGPATVE